MQEARIIGDVDRPEGLPPQAFPVLMPGSGEGLAACAVLGMDLRDYFVAHAPSRIPKWFEPEIEAYPNPEMPDRISETIIYDALDALGGLETHQGTLSARLRWLREGTWTLAQVLGYYDSMSDLCAAITVYWGSYVTYETLERMRDADRSTWRAKRERERVFQWPFFWAAQMMERRRGKA